MLLFLLSGSRGEEEEEERGGALCMTIPTSVRRFVLCGIRVGRRRVRGGWATEGGVFVVRRCRGNRRSEVRRWWVAEEGDL